MCAVTRKEGRGGRSKEKGKDSPTPHALAVRGLDGLAPRGGLAEPASCAGEGARGGGDEGRLAGGGGGSGQESGQSARAKQLG